MSLALLEVLEKKGSMSDVDLYKEVMSNLGRSALENSTGS